MVEPAQKIIVFDSFDNVIKANIIKTKLDAYGIPCFLTGENFVNLYPFRNELFPGVRLHIFEKDLDQVKTVLAEEVIPDAEALRCPRCGSRKVFLAPTEKGQWVRLIAAFLLVLFIPAKQVYRCQDCDTEFDR